MMKVAVVCKSDLRGGAAVVSYRLMKALRAEGVDARMVVCEKLSDDPYVIPAGSFWDIKRNFIVERLRVAAANGRSRETLWQIDPATDGLPLARHPWIKEADAVLLNWVNQGMLSTKGLENLLAEKGLVCKRILALDHSILRTLPKAGGLQPTLTQKDAHLFVGAKEAGFCQLRKVDPGRCRAKRNPAQPPDQGIGQRPAPFQGLVNF